MLSLSLLGAFKATLDEEPIETFRTKRVQALLIYLVCEAKRPFQQGSAQASSREQLMELLWPGLPPTAAQSNMRQTLYRLRKLIPDAPAVDGSGSVPFILSKNKKIQINPAAHYFADVQAFEQLIVQNPAQAIPLYRGDFLADFYLPDSENFEAWVATRRAEYRRQTLSALAELTTEALQEGNYDQAEQFARQQLTIDNLQESAHRQLIETLARNGRRANALNQYKELCQLLEAELNVQPETATEQLVEAIRHDLLKVNDTETAVLPSNAQPTSTNIKPRHNLSPQKTNFVGRQSELATLNDLLAQPQTRLITILGPGGIGKTRLATAVANQQLNQNRYADGIFFVPLAGLIESNRIASMVAEVLQLRLEHGETQLLNYLENKQLLLVLDNFEHLLAGADFVRRLLDAAPKLQILTTSREHLRLQGEQQFPIQGLQMDEDARRLFLQAAQRIRPDFEVTAELTPTLTHICHLVEGMPLALELAAAWLDMLTLPEIAIEIQNNLDFLETDLRDVPNRHRSMRAVFDTSWQQLSDNEQRLLAHVSIFRGGLTRDAAMTIIQTSLRDLARLVHKSLLNFDGENGRYHIHELLRQYSATHLQEDTDLIKRFNSYYCQWLISQKENLHTPQQAETIKKIEADMNNILKAINGYANQNQFSELQPTLATLHNFYLVHGKLQEGITLYTALANQLEAQPDWAPQTHIWLMIWLSSLNGMLFQQDESDDYRLKAKEILHHPVFKEKDTRAEVAAINIQEGYSIFRSNPEASVQLFREGVALFEAVGDSVWLIHSLWGLGRGLRHMNDFKAASEAFSRSLSIAQQLGDPVLQLEPQLLLYFQTMISGYPEKAEEGLIQMIEEIKLFNHPEILRMALRYLAMAQLMNGRFAAAMETNQQRRKVEIESGSFVYLLPVEEISNALLNLHLGRYEEASRLEQILTRTTGNLYYVSDAYVISGLISIAKGELAVAEKQFQLSQAQHLSGWVWICSWVHRFESGLALLAAIKGEFTTAEKLIYSELKSYVERYKQELNGRSPIAIVLAILSYLVAAQGNTKRAIELYSVAQQDNFVANSRWVADLIGKKITAVSATLPTQEVVAAQTRGQELDLIETAVSILDQ